MTNIDEIHRKLTIVRQEEEEQQQHQQTNSLDRDHYVANGQKDRKKTTDDRSLPKNESKIFYNTKVASCTLEDFS